MNKSAPWQNLKIGVKDFGPIIEADIELRPLTVFVGPGNTGKSYMAALLYALHRSFNGAAVSRNFPRFRWDESIERYQTLIDRNEHHEQLFQECIGRIEQFIQANFTDSGKFRVSNTLTFGSDLLGWINGEFRWGTSYFPKEIARCLGVSEFRPLLRKRGQAEVQLNLEWFGWTGKENFFRQDSEALVIWFHWLNEIVLKPDNMQAEELTRLVRQATRQRLSPNVASGGGNSALLLGLLDLLGNLLFPHMYCPLHMPTYYLPADRLGLMHAYKPIVSTLISDTAKSPRGRPLFSGMLADFLRQLNEIEDAGSSRGGFRKNLALGIEKEILGGSLRMENRESGPNSTIVYRPDGWKEKLPLMNASSMVTELAPLVLYLRHKVEPGNVLIIEEPEAHLHPAMQVELTRQLAMLIKEGVRVVITTHSEWVLEELSNIVHRSKVTDTVSGQRENGELALTREQVGIWLFQRKKRPKGSVVREVPLDDSGLYSVDYTKVAEELHNSWAEISSRVRDSK